MNRFLIRFAIFLILGYLGGEMVVRAFKLTSDIPQRYRDKFGLQLYKPGQKGFYKGAEYPWTVNEYGWIGVNDFEGRNKKVAIIGDSFIENLMNPISCHQGTKLQELNPGLGVLEAGRSGVTFIEALEISKRLDSLNFNRYLLYISDNDFYESLADKRRYPDRLQLDMASNTILEGELKSPGLKKVLYNMKFLYYLYQRFPLFVDEQNKGEIPEVSEFDVESFEKMFQFCEQNYSFDKISLVFHPGASQKITDFFRLKGVSTIILSAEDDKAWDLNEADGHWSCFGHEEAAIQVTSALRKMGF